MQPVVIPAVTPSGMNIPVIRGLGITQIVIGALNIILGIAVIPALSAGYWVNSSGSGIWFGIWILITGIIGVLSSKSPQNRGLNGTNMGFSIVCTVVSFFVGIFFAVAVAYFAACNEYNSYNRYDYRYRYRNGCYGDKGAGTALYALLLISMIAEFFISMVASIYCCQGGCCQQSTAGAVIIQQQAQPTYITTSSAGVVTSQYAPPMSNYPPATGYAPPQQQYQTKSDAYPPQNGAYPPQSGAYPPQGGAYPPQQYAPAPMGMATTNTTYSSQQQAQGAAGQPDAGQPMAPPPPYSQ